MPSADHGVEAIGLPSGTLDLIHQLPACALACVLGLLLGRRVATWMRAHHLHHNCAGAALVLVLLAHSLLGVEELLAVLSVGVCALRRTRRWHREDLSAGEDLGRAAKARRGPIALLAWVLRRAALTHLPELRLRRLVRGAIVIGRDDEWRAVTVPLARGSAGIHTLVVGATGSGKTVTQTRIAHGAIERGMAAVVIDPKGDAGLRASLAAAAGCAQRTFIDWAPVGDWVYNPFASGSDTELADKALSGERFTEPHYMRQAQRYLAHAVRALRASGETELSLRMIVAALQPQRLELLARELPVEAAEQLHEYLDGLSARQLADLSGVRDRLAILAESDVGPRLDPDADGVQRFDLASALQQRAVVYFNLEADRLPLLGQMLAAAIVQDLQTVVAGCQGRPLPTLVLIDEFSAVGVEHVVRLFARARSAGFSLLLGTQEISDLRPPGGERLLEQVLGNLTTLIAHRQVVIESARALAALAGSEREWRVSQHSDGRTTRTRGRYERLDVERIRELPPGRAAVIELGARVGTRIADVFPVTTQSHAMSQSQPTRSTR